MAEALRALSGFGGVRHSLAHVSRPQRRAPLLALLQGDAGPLLARGLGRAYGDAAQIESGHVVDMTRLDRLLDFDPASGVLVCEAGMRLAEIDRIFLPRGFCLPVVPGTSWVTLGGAIAADVHGKNHDRVGSFGDHVQWLDLLTADGNIRRVDPIATPALFAATIGGMGLSGIILQAAIKLQSDAKPAIAVRERKLTDLDALLLALTAQRPNATYSVAWVDAMARGKALGRAIFETGDPAEASAGLRPSRTRRLPVKPPEFLPLKWIGKGFNAAWLARLPAAGRDRVIARERFFYPLDAIAGWNKVYGRRGFHQFQCVLPDDLAPQALRRMLELTAKSRAGALLAVLKTLGSPGRGYLSFAIPDAVISPLPCADTRWHSTFPPAPMRVSFWPRWSA